MKHDLFVYLLLASDVFHPFRKLALTIWHNSSLYVKSACLWKQQNPFVSVTCLQPLGWQLWPVIFPENSVIWGDQGLLCQMSTWGIFFLTYLPLKQKKGLTFILKKSCCPIPLCYTLPSKALHPVIWSHWWKCTSGFPVYIWFIKNVGPRPIWFWSFKHP